MCVSYTIALPLMNLSHMNILGSVMKVKLSRLFRIINLLMEERLLSIQVVDSFLRDIQSEQQVLPNAMNYAGN